MSVELREKIRERLFQDLIGPYESNELINDRPSQVYSTGILYPQDSKIAPEEDEDGGAGTEDDESDSGAGEQEVSLLSASKPSTAGISFAVKCEGSSTFPILSIEVTAALYEMVAGKEKGERPKWQRKPVGTKFLLSIKQREGSEDLSVHGIEGLEVYYLATTHGGVKTLTLALTNRRNRGKLGEGRDFDEEQHFFQVKMVASMTNGSIVPRPALHAATDEDSRISMLIYRDVQEYVVGHTCSSHADLSLEGDMVIAVSTQWLPCSKVPRVDDKGDKFFKKLFESMGEHEPLMAKWLAKANPVELKEALVQLVSCYEAWIDAEETKVPGLPNTVRGQGVQNIKVCREGAARMRAGIELISKDENVRHAFQLAQEAMAIQFRWTMEKKDLTWRPFQLGFQLLTLASLAQRDHVDRSVFDLLWFPTGGGKTEAYLALTAFVVFLRRLRAEKGDDGEGVAVLMRYTLRLLTIQQFQRASAMIFACELIRRRKDDNKLGRKPIGIGLWVGSAATPLTLQEAVDASDGNPSNPRQLTKCPCCGSKLNWAITHQKSTVTCEDKEKNCDLAKLVPDLPIWTIDEEVYKNTPSLVIGTVDKFAQIVRKLDTGRLFGINTTNAPPDLIIQDELHLISGPLGSTTGLYEVAIDELCRRDSIRPKVIGSTATIRRAAEQASALFDRSTYQFPAPGLSHKNSGFAVTDDASPGRMYLGITTAGRSATYMLQAITASLLSGAADPKIPKSERDHYWTLVLYFNSLRELGRALVLMQDDVRATVRQISARRGEPARALLHSPSELTSRVSAVEIRDMLDVLKRKCEDPNSVDLLLASNMISVGMDVPRLGMMLVNAQPKSLSEYIQATSRVGRSEVPGLVITMYNNTRARDRSRFETFETWHRSLYREVEATSVTPFASRSQDKALHAVLVGLVRHLIPAMRDNPVLTVHRRAEVEKIASIIENRVARIDRAEITAVSHKLKTLIDEWISRDDLEVYWKDHGKSITLLLSAEQYAAQQGDPDDDDDEGVSRAVWATPNSMREVEPGTPFVLRRSLRARE